MDESEIKQVIIEHIKTYENAYVYTDKEKISRILGSLERKFFDIPTRSLLLQIQSTIIELNHTLLRGVNDYIEEYMDRIIEHDKSNITMLNQNSETSLSVEEFNLLESNNASTGNIITEVDIIDSILRNIVFGSYSSNQPEISFDDPEPNVISERQLETLQLVKCKDLVLNEDQEKLCSICQNDIFDEDIIPKINCGHLYHKECLFVWLQRYSIQCPMCRALCI